MDRRAFIGASAVGTAAASVIAAPGRTTPAGRDAPPRAPVPDMNDYLARVDAGMARIAAWSPTGTRADTTATDTLARGALQSLYMTAMFGDLPIPAQVHPGMQDRMWAALPWMEDATDAMEAFLTAQTPAQLNAIRRALQHPDDPGQQITDALVLEAERSGVSARRQRELRVLMNRALWRLKHQPPGVVVNEYLDKVQRLAASDVDSEARRQWLAARVAERLFWDERIQNTNPDQVLEAIEAMQGAQATQPRRSKRDARVRRGARTMGIGLLAGVVSAVLIATEGDAAVGIGLVLGTVGAIFFLVGLIILLVGLGTKQEEPHPADSLPADSTRS